jgi:uncharacterized membrane protein
MGPITIVFSLLLIVLGAVFYLTGHPNPETGHVSFTALIPAFVGLPLLLLGVLALKDNLRKHAMHAAAALGLLGFLGGAIMGVPHVPALLAGTAERPNAVIEQLLLALICAVFVGLCVRSFVVARMNRAKQAAAPPEGSR